MLLLKTTVLHYMHNISIDLTRYMHKGTYTNAYARTYTHTYIHTDMRTLARTHASTHINMDTHTHTSAYLNRAEIRESGIT
jgi:hypothetical protein